MTGFHALGAAVIGTGFIGTVHTEALRRLGVCVHGVLGSSAERGAERAPMMGAARSYRSLDDLLSDDAVDVVHVTSPNHAHYSQVRDILAAGKHVVCEKPLALNSAQSAEMLEWERRSDRICAVNYNIRFYPLNQHARQMAANGSLGTIRLVTGHYLQDWLARDTDWNWRLETESGGALRSFGDIGTHWFDLTSFISGLQVTEVFAELTTFVNPRYQPMGPVETFGRDGGGGAIAREITTDDSALVLFRYQNGARGSVAVSQVSCGRKNALQWEIDGTHAATAWHSESPDRLWIGHRDEPNQILSRDAALMNPAGAAAANLPGGHVEGFADTFYALYKEVYAAVLKGLRPSDPPYATFSDGHRSMLVCDAVLKSAGTGQWAEV